MKMITILPADEMLQRLVTIDNEPHMRERFYPILLRIAGQERTGEGIAVALMLAVHDYTAAMLPMMQTVMQMRVHTFVSAFTNDEDARAAAMAHLAAVGLPTS